MDNLGNVIGALPTIGNEEKRTRMLACAIGKSLILVLTQENLKRMAEGDPVTHMVRPLMPGAPDTEAALQPKAEREGGKRE